MTTTLYAVTFDCGDAAALAGFWAGVLGRSVDDGATPEFASIGLESPASSRPHWMFVQVPEGKTAKNRMHTDLIIDVADLAAETERLLGLGAVKLAEHEDGGTRWVTLADPEGNEFDVMADGQ
jgi:predicted enzyme related to lactoylglutathione lyase